MDKTLFLVRGPPGSGKSSLARELVPGAAFAADDFFELGGKYEFDPAQLGTAHQWCIQQVAQSMFEEVSLIAVHNTLSQRWEAEPYFELAKAHGYAVFVVECQNDFGNVHGVPPSTIEAMRERWEPLQGSPLPLWRVVRARTTKAWRGLLRFLTGKSS